MKRVTRHIIVMRRKTPGDGVARPAGRRLYVDEGATTTARHRATLFLGYEIPSQLDSWRAALGDRMFSIESASVLVPEGARSLGHDAQP